MTVLTLASTPAWVVSWLLPYGEAAMILEPEPAREAMRETCRAILRDYGEDALGALASEPTTGKPA